MDRKLRLQLRRGRQGVDGAIDLHGMTQEVAHRALTAFLERSQAQGARLVLVVTGKGARSPVDGGTDRGVLNRLVPHWLRLPGLRSLVLGFEEAGPRQGGAGALYVRLRRPGRPA
jgi:DNA-nicking Smr family endonuclease